MAWLLEVRLLGPVEAVIDGRPVRLPAAKPRALLAVLLLDRNRVVSVGRLVEDLWGDDPPETATKALQGYVSQLRKALGADRLLTKPPGYSLRVEDGELDLDRFEGLLREGRELRGAGDSKAAARRLAEALELWRGTPFAEFESEPFARDAGARLEDARLAVLEERIEADLALGRPTRLIPGAEGLDGGRLEHDRSLERARAPARQAEDGAPVPLARRPQFLVQAALVLAVIAAVIAAVALTSGGSSGKGASGSGELRSFVDKLENFLGQSHDGRVAVAA